MSQTTQTQTVVRLINEVMQKPEEYKEEAKLILTIELHNRTSGCGYVYLYREDLEIIEGSADIVTLEKREYNCDVIENVAVIPKSVPVLIKVVYRDEDPEVGDYIQYYVFTPNGWRSVKVILPKE